MSRSNDRSDRLRRFALAAGRWAGPLLLGAALLLSVALVAVHLLVDGPFLASRLSGALGPRYAVQVDEAVPGFWGRSLRVRRLEVHSARTSVPASVREVAEPALRLEIGSLALERLDLWTLITGGGVRFASISIEAPKAELTVPRADTGRSESTSTRSAPGSMRTLSAGLLRLRDGALTVRRAGGEIEPIGIWDGVSMTARDWRLNGTSRAAVVRSFIEGDGEVRFERFRRPVRSGLYELSVAGVRGSARDSTLFAREMHLRPGFAPDEMVQTLNERDPRLELSVRSISVHGLDLERLLGSGGILARRVATDSLDLHVLEDKQLPDENGDPTWPHEWARSSTRVVAVRTVRLREADLTYSIRPPEGDRTGHLTFADLTLRASHLATANAPMRGDSTRVRVSGRLAPATPFRIALDLDLTAPEVALAYRAATGAADLRSLDSILVPVSGISLQSGRVDTLFARAAVEEGAARGTLVAVYRDLDVRFEGGDQMRDRLSSFFKSLIFDRLILESSNLPGEDGALREGRIERELDEDVPFLKFLWQSLRSGMLDLALG